MSRYKDIFEERMAMMIEDENQTFDAAQVQATWEARKAMVDDGMDFMDANLKVMGIRREYAGSH